MSLAEDAYLTLIFFDGSTRPLHPLGALGLLIDVGRLLTWTARQAEELTFIARGWVRSLGLEVSND